MVRVGRLVALLNIARTALLSKVRLFQRFVIHAAGIFLKKFSEFNLYSTCLYTTTTTLNKQYF